MFYIPSEVPKAHAVAPQPRKSAEEPKSDARNSRAPTQSPSSDWDDWPSDGWGLNSEGVGKFRIT